MSLFVLIQMHFYADSIYSNDVWQFLIFLKIFWKIDPGD